MTSRGTSRQWSKPLVALAAVFLALALCNGLVVLFDRALWRGATAAGCAVVAAALLAAGRRR
ncbi:hypothetical protein JOF41_003812 [Saccharothrix coeruleofusca]|uniref:hypothetical protein n=1 Tax=Saccharothrix coeruleofusca TaxID=33919 RepID=UPI001AE11FE9|nr:hypothetical protein [Saccharothrix coeruleofusca]MBP2337634.1 hypothetical protein [Saccharothrix coeruleofusca]